VVNGSKTVNGSETGQREILKTRLVLKESIQPLKKHQSLAQSLVEALTQSVKDGTFKAGDKLPPEASIELQFGVSRTVVREAIPRLQAAGLVKTRHGIGTFILEPSAYTPFRLTAEDFNTLKDVIAVLELRIGVEVEAAALAAVRRTDQNLFQIEAALKSIQAEMNDGRDAVLADFQFHREIARASQNPHFADLMSSMGASIIPRARLTGASKIPLDQDTLTYLNKVNSEHESIFAAIQGQDPEAARAAMRIHLSNSKDRRRQQLT